MSASSNNIIAPLATTRRTRSRRVRALAGTVAALSLSSLHSAAAAPA
jgi:hypothetical protein